MCKNEKNAEDKTMVLSKLPYGREFVARFLLLRIFDVVCLFCVAQLTCTLTRTFGVACREI